MRPKRRSGRGGQQQVSPGRSPGTKRIKRPPRPSREGLGEQDKESAPEAQAPESAPPTEEPAPPEPSTDVLDERLAEVAQQNAERVQELEAKVAELSASLGQLHDKPDEAGPGIDAQMQDLLRLSELISVRYNPFLKDEEPSLYDDQDVRRFLPKDPPEPRPGSEVVTVQQIAAQDAGEAATPDLEPDVVPVEPDAPDEPHGSTAEVDPDEPVIEARHADAETVHEEPQPEAKASTRPEDQTMHTEAADVGAMLASIEWPDNQPGDQEVVEAEEGVAPQTTPKAEGPATNAPGSHESAPSAMPADAAPHSADQSSNMEPLVEPEPHVGDREARPPRPRPVRGPTPRQSHHVLRWFERLSHEGDPSEIHLFVDHYARLGWIAPEHVDWMRLMADAVAPRRADLDWDDLQLHGVDLARLHQQHLRFLQRLFHDPPAHDDPRGWDREADAFWEGT